MTNQSHAGSGDNVAGNKRVNNYVAINSIWIAVGVLLVGLLIWLVPQLLPEPVSLTGYVVSSANVPMDKAKVVVYLPGKEEPIDGYTDENGVFSFEKVDVSDHPTFRLEAQFHERNQSLELQNISIEDLPITVQMPAGTPPFEVKYLELAGFEVDFLLSGQVNPKMEKLMGGQPLIIPNSVYETLKGLGDEFSVPLSKDLNPPLSYHNDINNPDLINKRYWSEKPEFFTRKILGTDQSHINGTDKDLNIRADRNSHLNFVNSVSNWELDGKILQESDWADLLSKNEFNMTPALPRISLRILDQEEFNRIPEVNGGILLKFYQHLTKEYYPPGFIGLNFHSDTACGDDYPLRLNAPDLRVKVAVLENTSRDPIPLDSFYILENKEIRLRLEDKDLNSEHSPKAMKLLPQKTLKAGGKVLIPLAIQLAYREDWRKDESASYVYHYGPSWDVKEVKVGVEKYPFRAIESKVFVLLEGTTVRASCPFAFTYDSQSGEWLIENHFLYKKNKRTKQGFDTLSLKRFTGKLLIREIDPETSFIDLIEIHFKAEDGEAKILRPHLENLHTKDGRHLITNQGDEVMLIFNEYNKDAKGEYFLISYGWYEPYEEPIKTKDVLDE